MILNLNLELNTMKLNFDATNVDTTNHYDAIPAGDYLVMITASQSRATKDGTGEYLELTLEVQDGAYRGRKLWDRLNLSNKNQKAVEIAQRQLAQICHAVGVLQLQDTAEPLHYKPLVAIVRVKDGMNGPVNEVKGYKKSAGAAAPATAPVAAPRQAAAATPPWANARA